MKIFKDNLTPGQQQIQTVQSVQADRVKFAICDAFMNYGISICFFSFPLPLSNIWQYALKSFTESEGLKIHMMIRNRENPHMGHRLQDGWKRSIICIPSYMLIAVEEGF